MSTPPLGWGSTYCFTAVGVTPITMGTPAQFFFFGGMFLFSRSLSFDFCYDLDIWAQGQAFCYLFLHNFIKSMREILIKHGRKLHRDLAYDPIIVDL